MRSTHSAAAACEACEYVHTGRGGKMEPLGSAIAHAAEGGLETTPPLLQPLQIEFSCSTTGQLQIQQRRYHLVLL